MFTMLAKPSHRQCDMNLNTRLARNSNPLELEPVGIRIAAMSIAIPTLTLNRFSGDLVAIFVVVVFKSGDLIATRNRCNCDIAMWTRSSCPAFALCGRHHII